MNQMKPEIRTFFVSAVGMSTVAWRIAFNLGAFKTVFFESIFGVWVAVTVILVGLLLMPGRDTALPIWGKALMLIPTLALLSAFLNTAVAAAVSSEVDSWLDSWLILLGVFAAVVSLPYAIYLAVKIIDIEIFQLPGIRLKVMLFSIVVAMALTGFFVGANNDHFLNCGDFKISGNDLPVNCRPGPPFQLTDPK